MECRWCGKEYKTLRTQLYDKIREIKIPGCNCTGPNDRLDRIYRLKKNCALPFKFRKDDMKDFVTPRELLPLHEFVKNYLDNLQSFLGRQVGMFLSGSVGIGKTRLICYLANRMIELDEHAVFFVSGSTFESQLDVLKRYRNDFEDYLEKLCSVEILIFDDFAESFCPFNKKYYSKVINDRYLEGRVILFTSMFDLQKNEEIFGPHIMSRIKEMVKENYIRLDTKLDFRALDGNTEITEKNIFNDHSNDVAEIWK